MDSMGMHDHAIKVISVEKGMEEGVQWGSG